MPTYQFRCPNGHTHEITKSIHEPTPEECPTCGDAMRVVLQPFAAHFKGSGFYATDYGKRSRSAGRADS